MADVTTMKARQTLLQKKCDLILAAAERDARALTDDEKKELTAMEQEIEGLTGRIERTERDAEFTAKLNDVTPGGGGTKRGSATPLDGLPPRDETWGRTFTSHAAIAEFLKAGIPTAGSWSSPSVELRAATLLESTSPIVQPQYLPGIIPGPQPPVVMSQLFAPGTATSGLISYTEETVTTNAADAVTEGAAKPESTLTFAQKQEPLHKVATWLPASTEILTDIPQMQSYIDGRLRLFVLVKLDDELLNGSGVDPHFKGLLTRTDLSPAVAATGNGIDAIAQQIAAVENTSQLPVDGIVLNSQDWLTMSLVKTTTGEYIGGNPFQVGGPRTLFGRAVATTPAMPQGTALVGSFKGGGGQLFMHPAMRTAISNSHQDFFVKNLVAILSEIRAALALYRPVAFGTVTGLPAPTP
jgi:HK97 family phage major capsid protein